MVYAKKGFFYPTATVLGLHYVSTPVRNEMGDKTLFILKLQTCEQYACEGLQGSIFLGGGGITVATWMASAAQNFVYTNSK